MSKTKSKPKNAPQQETGGDCHARLVRLVESAIRSTAGRMFLDIHIDEDVTARIGEMIREEIGHQKTDDQAVRYVIRRMFSDHEARMEDAARDDSNMAMAHAFRSLPNVQSVATADENQSNQSETL